MASIKMIYKLQVYMIFHFVSYKNNEIKTN